MSFLHGGWFGFPAFLFLWRFLIVTHFRICFAPEQHRYPFHNVQHEKLFIKYHQGVRSIPTERQYCSAVQAGLTLSAPDDKTTSKPYGAGAGDDGDETRKSNGVYPGRKRKSTLQSYAFKVSFTLCTRVSPSSSSTSTSSPYSIVECRNIGSSLTIFHQVDWAIGLPNQIQTSTAMQPGSPCAGHSPLHFECSR